ncbi:hypothetical protein GTA08_BOTSDO01237 [Neofusicoccum parvum]|uniref:Uncharacterized protein n=3 Tax=Neofusicoccum TaxID=407951 RepID=R1EZF5_BOTPV|nr:hypothetical protein UCRNP2_202 [Neofusicoccum parvum UCRNP2]GME25968.1 hypothetical protein GTA08_BOTSDO01237 [Neofusicoccum parvum]GME54956.1 hypothetical protein GTA08_BOTSDO01237 [Neofusicoccum parvum]
MPVIRHAIRRYSSRAYGYVPRYSRLQLLAAHTAITAGVVLPFVHPYMQTRQAKRDGTYMTKPPIPFTPSPKF